MASKSCWDPSKIHLYFCKQSEPCWQLRDTGLSKVQEVPGGARCSGAAGAPWEEQEAGKPQTQLTSSTNEARRLSKHAKPGEREAGPMEEDGHRLALVLPKHPWRVGATEGH